MKKLLFCITLPMGLLAHDTPVTSETNNAVQVPDGIKTLHFHNSNIVKNNNMPKIIVNVWNYTSATVNTILHKTRETALSNFQIVSDFVRNNKKMVGIGTGVGLYASLWLYISYLQRCVHSSDSWSSWKSHIPLDILLTTQQHEVARELVIDIQKKYTSAELLADFISPLVQFMNTLDKEKRSLERYLYIQKWLHRCYLHKLFPHDQKSIAKAQEKVDRLMYLKQLLIEWISEYKIQTSGTRDAAEDKE